MVAYLLTIAVLASAVLSRAISISDTHILPMRNSRSTLNEDAVDNIKHVLNKRDARVESKQIIYTYSCPKTGLTTQSFELALYYWPLLDKVDWTNLRRVTGFNHRWESEREAYKPIKASAVWYWDTCPDHQALDDICSYHYEGHVFAEIYRHFIYLDGVGMTENPADVRAPVVWESCVDMSRAAHTHTCPVIEPRLKTWTICTVTDVDIGPLTD